MKIIGIRPSSFPGSNNEQIGGKNIYLTYPLEKGKVSALSVFSSPMKKPANERMCPKLATRFRSSRNASASVTVWFRPSPLRLRSSRRALYSTKAIFP